MKALRSFVPSTLALIITSFLTASSFADTTPAQVDPDMQKVLDTLAGLGGKPIEDLKPEEARKQPTPADAVKKILQDTKRASPDSDVTVKEIKIPGPLGQIPAFTFTPAGKGPFPVLVYFHGGGFVIANTKTYESSARALAKSAGALVISVDYRQAPEFKFPAAPNDAFAAYKWVLEHAKDVNGDAKRVAVGGESAGGNLATVVSIMARDQKVSLPVHQLLIYPVVSDDLNSPSYKRNENAKPLNKKMMKWFFKYYAADPKSPQALPIKADSLNGLPPATIIAAEIDPLESEGKAYADRLRIEGVPVEYREYQGVTHEFFGMGAVVKKAKDAEDYAAEQLRKAFEK